jgi:hypothetical protein
MNSTGYFGNQVSGYTPFWSKYRPSILKMMMAAETEPQQYKFYSHELKGLNTSAKTFSFSLQVVGARISNPVKAPIIAKELYSMLQYSKKATELMEGNNYEFKLDSKFLFHVTRIEPTPANQD